MGIRSVATIAPKSITADDIADGSLTAQLLAPGSVQQISTLSGTIAHGGTIPIPSGYTEAECKWMVSKKSLGGGHPVKNEQISADGTRVVTCQAYDPSYPQWDYGTVNYVIIGVK